MQCAATKTVAGVALRCYKAAGHAGQHAATDTLDNGARAVWPNVSSSNVLLDMDTSVQKAKDACMSSAEALGMTPEERVEYLNCCAALFSIHKSVAARGNFS